MAGFAHRVHDLLLCGADPFSVEMTHGLKSISSASSTLRESTPLVSEDPHLQDISKLSINDNPRSPPHLSSNLPSRPGVLNPHGSITELIDGDSSLFRADPQSVDETTMLLRLSRLHWRPHLHAFLFGPSFQSKIESVCLVKVSF